MESAQVVICGAGIAGVAAAYFLTVEHGLDEVLLVDERPPLSLTSDKSTECYRNAWPDPAMAALMNRSIHLLEDLARAAGNRFHLNRRGYLYLSASPERLRLFSERLTAAGAGPLRIGANPDAPDGLDFFPDRSSLHHTFPYLSEQAAAGLFVHRAGWFSGQQLGQYLLEEARAHGATLLRARMVGVEVARGRVRALQLRGEGAPAKIATPCLVNAAGPFVTEVAHLLGEDLPVFHERHRKLAFADTLGVVPRDAPLLIWNDPQRLPWTEEERDFLASDPELAFLLDEMPPGAHTRPEGGADSPIALALWGYHTQPVEPTFPLPDNPIFPEVVLRGLAAMLPGVQGYFQRLPRPIVDGGYYTRTRENRPLIGPLRTDGAYVVGALAGFGMMAACAAGELLAAHVASAPLPDGAPVFHPLRYERPDYQRAIAQLTDDGAL